eukprot:m.122912 g.122912  ORF g.122912 m.122912 type:complete len:127 (+) comp28946_c0_seq2:84-464(+)
MGVSVASFITPLAFLIHFLVTAGIFYDVIVVPPSVGTTTDSKGNVRPKVFMSGKVNGQYINEGAVSGAMFVAGGLGLILLDKASDLTRMQSSVVRSALQLSGLTMVVMSVIALSTFISIKIPGYMR